MSTPVRRTPSTRRTPKPKTPKDVRQLDRDEMIEYLQQHDEEIPTDVDDWKRASLKKRVIHCMKQQNMNGTPMSNINMPSQRVVQSAAISRISRKRKPEHPLTCTRNKRMKTNANGNQGMLKLLPIMQESPEHKAEDIDISLLKINFDFRDNCNTNFDFRDNNTFMMFNDDEMINKLLKAVKNGIPARYDITPLPCSISNLKDDTSYLRSSQMQKLFDKCHIEQEIHCSVRTSDDEYALNNDDIIQIEVSVGEWINTYGEYSSNIHPSICQNSDNKLEAKDYIFQYEVLGRLIGDEMTDNEYYQIYSGTFDEYRRSLHSWVFEVNIPIIDKNSDSNDPQNMKYDQYDMLVDCLGKIDKDYSKLLLVEDCRSDLTKFITTKADLNKENVLFVTIEINGWPGKWAIAKRNINKSDLLYGHFGDGYGSLRKQVKRQTQSVDLFVSSIQSLIQNQ